MNRHKIHRPTLRWVCSLQIMVFVAGTVQQALAAAQRPADRWEELFRNPPASTRPWCYWYWISDNISTAGILRDLEAMQRVGIGAALIGHIYLSDSTPGDVPLFSDAWWTAIRHALREADRFGIELGLFNCPGWSQSGGPWNPPERSMRRITYAETRIVGPGPVAVRLPVPADPPYQDLAVLAIPDPEEPVLATWNPTVITRPVVQEVHRLWDAQHETALQLPRTVDIEFSFPRATVLGSLTLYPTATEFRTEIAVFTGHSSDQLREVRRVVVDRRKLQTIVGYWPFGPVTLTWAPTTATTVRVAIRTLDGNLTASELTLSGRPVVEYFVEKQLAKMCPDALPTWDGYRWPPPPTEAADSWRLLPEQVLNLTSNFQADGVLHWVAPTGGWRVLRFGWTSTGVSNHPASPQGTGLEVDKLDRHHVAHHFDSFIGEVLRRIPPHERRALKYVVADSYETGAQNWTDDLRERFRRDLGYDPLPWWPALAGYPVGSLELSDRFLWDLRRWVADQIAREYVGGLRQMCEQHGLQLWLENYGHWGFPSEFLLYGKYAHMLGGEFWVPWRRRADELRAASSAGHIYSHRRISAEAFTSARPFEFAPADLQPVGDWVLTQGINHWVLHVVLHQPWDDRRPGVSAWFGTEFNRHTPWFSMAAPFVEYFRRSQALLQEGWPATDLAYFIGEDAPVMTGITEPPPPEGYDYDFVNADVILHHFTIRNGRWTLPNGHSYALLVLPPSDAMRPQVLQRIRDLVRQGGVLYGPPPRRSPSLQNYPAADAEVRTLAVELWGNTPSSGSTARVARSVGRGRVFYGGSLQDILSQIHARPVVRDLNGLDWAARRSPEGSIVFLVNTAHRTTHAAPWFPVRGLTPEIWDPLTGQRGVAPVVRHEADGVRVGLALPPHSSVLVVFRTHATPSARSAVTLTHDGRQLLTADPSRIERSSIPFDPVRVAGTFTYEVWAEPHACIQLPVAPTTRGTFLHLTNNWVLYPEHGGRFGDPDTEAGVGLSIGRNGIAVYEHGANYFVPTLVYAIEVTGRSHVVVVYDSGRPHLYLDGKKVASGIPSARNAHPSVGVPTAPPPFFAGHANSIHVWPAALDASEIEQRAAREPMAISEDAVRYFPHAQPAGTWVAVFPGRYELETSEDRTLSCIVPELPVAKLDGPWSVEFPAGSGAPRSCTWTSLLPLNEHTNAAVRYFAGTLTYRHTLIWTGAHEWVELDLGDLRDTAEVRLNDQPLGIVWKPPYRLDVTRAIRSGTNELVVTVAVGWRNRILGHLRYPQGLPDAGPDAQPVFLTATPRGWKPDAPLSPAGLIGPVLLRGGQVLRFDSAAQRPRP